MRSMTLSVAALASAITLAPANVEAQNCWTSICQCARICFDPLNLRDSGVDFPPFGSRRPDFSPAASGGSGLPA